MQVHDKISSSPWGQPRCRHSNGIKMHKMTRSCAVTCRATARRWGRTLLSGIVLSLFVAETALAQAIVIDPRMLPSGSPLSGSGSSSDTGGVTGAGSDSEGSGNATVAAVPAFKPADISPRKEAEAIAETGSDKGRLDRPSAAPSEFEKYVYGATGRWVRRYGADLLLPDTRDFTVPATSTIPGDYPIGVGDMISVNTVGSVEGSADFTVDRNGEIFLPQVGNVRLLGVRYRDLEDRISEAIGRKYRGFEATVSIKKLRGIRVYVTGFANNPGSYTLNSLSTLTNAVLAAGGPSGGGSFRSIKLYRNGREVRDFDLYELIRRGNSTGDAILQNEDVLFIPPVGPQVAVIGSVNEEAIYEARPGESLQSILQFAGGPNQLADSTHAILYRLDDKNTVGSRQILLSDVTGTPVAGGDIVQLLSEGTLAHPMERQSVVVRIEGEVNRPGNYFVAPNTPLSAILEQAGGLSSRAYVYGTRLTRESVRAQQRVGYRDAVDQLEATLAAAPLTPDSTISAADREAQMRSARVLLDKLRTAEPDGRLVLELPYSATTLPGDLVLENNDRIIVPPRIDTVGVFGAVYRPASFLLGSRSLKVQQFIDRAGGTQRMADKRAIFVVRANGDVLTRKNGALNARVQPGDVVFVPVKTQAASVWAKIKDITQIIFQLGLGAATVAAIK